MRADRDIEYLTAPSSDLLRQLVAYWDAKRGQQASPPRSAIDPLELKDHLSHIFMLDVLDGGADYRYRLIGTDVGTRSGRYVTGKTFSELYAARPATFARIKSIFGKVVSEHRPVFVRGPVFWLPERDYLRFDAAYLPLSSSGEAVEVLLCEVLFS